jgi:hypothetical protein
MKKNFLMILALTLLVISCKDKTHNKYLANSPVYTSYEEFRKAPEFKSAQTIAKGAIYFKDDHLFIIEPDKGIHFIDNTDPSNPVNVGFLDVWGCTGMSIRGDYLYVNSFIDMIVMNVSDLYNPVVSSRIEDAFPFALPVSDGDYPMAEIDKTKGVVTSWEIKKVKEEVDNNTNWNGCFNCGWNTFDGGAISFNESNGTASGAPPSVGTAGSMAVFTVVGDYLYVISEDRLQPFDLTNASDPDMKQAVGVWGDVETLFPYEDYIFMGTPTGMLVYGTADPSTPNYISGFSHARGCDPVVVQDDYAYVTVRSGGPCGGNINQMDIIDVSNISSPILKNSYNMKNPHGLGINGSLLFVCDGDAGLKVYDATDPETSGDNLVEKFKNIQATDVIPLGSVAMVIGDDGLYQYDYSDPTDLQLLSKIKF